MKKIVLCLLVAGLLTGCSTDPYTGESRASRTAIGAGVGTALGAGVGALAGGKKGALIGAGVGALAGTGAGAYMDVQAKRLRQELLNTGVQVVQDKESGRIILIMPGNITFGTNETTIQPGFEPVLGSVAKVIKEYNKTMVMVTGYTDSTGTAALNNDLSYRRANSVANFLKIQGVSADRLLIDGKGSQNPIASNQTAEGRAQNRRVEIVLVNKQ